MKSEDAAPVEPTGNRSTGTLHAPGGAHADQGSSAARKGNGRSSSAAPEQDVDAHPEPGARREHSEAHSGRHEAIGDVSSDFRKPPSHDLPRSRSGSIGVTAAHYAAALVSAAPRSMAAWTRRSVRTLGSTPLRRHRNHVDGATSASRKTSAMFSLASPASFSSASI